MPAAVAVPAVAPHDVPEEDCRFAAFAVVRRIGTIAGSVIGVQWDAIHPSHGWPPYRRNIRGEGVGSISRCKASKQTSRGALEVLYAQRGGPVDLVLSSAIVYELWVGHVGHKCGAGY